VAVRTHPRWRAVFTPLEQRRGSGKAIVAVARKLLVVAWHVLQVREADRHADAAQVARTFFSWSERVGKVARGGEPAGTLVRRELTRLGIGADLTRVTRGGQVCRVPPASASTGRAGAGATPAYPRAARAADAGRASLTRTPGACRPYRGLFQRAQWRLPGVGQVQQEISQALDLPPHRCAHQRRS